MTYKWPAVFETGKLARTDKLAALADGLEGWGIVMGGGEMPEHFGDGMQKLAELLEISGTPESFMQLSKDRESGKVTL